MDPDKMYADDWPYAVKHTRDHLGGEYTSPMTVGRYTTLPLARAALLRFGHGYIEHIPSGAQLHNANSQYGADRAIWIDSNGNEMLHCNRCGAFYPAKLRVCRCDCQTDSEFFGDDVE